MSKAGKSGERLRKALESSHALGEELAGPDFPLPAFEALQSFQLNRLARHYADLQAQDVYRDAVTFFLEELYGGLRFRERDRQVEQVLPVMIRLLPGRMLHALAEAFRLQALSIELDIRLSRLMAARNGQDLDTRAYTELYRTVPRAQREEQIRLIHALGLELCRVARHKGVLLLIRGMRGPAHAAGFGALQTFLEQGLASFRIMRGAGGAFVETIRERETRVMEHLYAGDPDVLDV